VTVTTSTTLPGPHIEHVQTYGSREGSAAAARSRGVSFADDSNAPAGLLALILQLRFEHAPAGVEHGFRDPCLDQLGAIYIAYEDPLILVDYLGRKFMQRILAAALSLSKSNPVNHFAAPANGRVALALVALAQFQT